MTYTWDHLHESRINIRWEMNPTTISVVMKQWSYQFVSLCLCLWLLITFPNNLFSHNAMQCKAKPDKCIPSSKCQLRFTLVALYSHLTLTQSSTPSSFNSTYFMFQRTSWTLKRLATQTPPQDPAQEEDPQHRLESDQWLGDRGHDNPQHLLRHRDASQEAENQEPGPALILPGRKQWQEEALVLIFVRWESTVFQFQGNSRSGGRE